MTFVTCNCDVQVCVDSVESGLNAARGGASRLEVGNVTCVSRVTSGGIEHINVVVLTPQLIYVRAYLIRHIYP